VKTKAAAIPSSQALGRIITDSPWFPSSDTTTAPLGVRDRINYRDLGEQSVERTLEQISHRFCNMTLDNPDSVDQ
jgi:hypothetical protein